MSALRSLALISEVRSETACQGKHKKHDSRHHKKRLRDANPVADQAVKQWRESARCKRYGVEERKSASAAQRWRKFGH